MVASPSGPAPAFAKQLGILEQMAMRYEILMMLIDTPEHWARADEVPDAGFIWGSRDGPCSTPPHSS